MTNKSDPCGNCGHASGEHLWYDGCDTQEGPCDCETFTSSGVETLGKLLGTVPKHRIHLDVRKEIDGWIRVDGATEGETVFIAVLPETLKDLVEQLSKIAERLD